MSTEIERKFLVKGESWRPKAPGTPYRQGYLSTDPDRTVRVRIAGERARLTIKGRTVGATRAEYEYDVPVHDATEILERLAKRPLIEKTRYVVEVSGLAWEIDEFHGANQGLVIAEVELDSEGQSVAIPDWCGEEVTGDSRYYNANLVERPFESWSSR